MEPQHTLLQLFNKYVSRTSTPEEVEELFRLARRKANKKVLQQLIEQELTRNATADHQAIEKAISDVRIQLLAHIRTTNQPVTTGAAMLRLLTKRGMLSAAAIFLLAGAATGYLYFTRYLGHNTIHTQNLITQIAITRRTERKEVRLFDGSKVWLSPSTTIRYADQLVAGKRQVYLDGEAFFEVAKDKKHPFIIHSGQRQTEVVGTSFDVKSYSDREEYAVRVVTGKVKVALMAGVDKKLSEVVLVPKQEAIFNKRQAVLRRVAFESVQQIVDTRYGVLSYNGAPVAEVVADLRRAYSADISLTSDSANCEFYGVLDTRKPVAIALKQLTTAINARLRTDGEHYTIEGGCDER